MFVNFTPAERALIWAVVETASAAALGAVLVLVMGGSTYSVVAALTLIVAAAGYGLFDAIRSIFVKDEASALVDGDLARAQRDELIADILDGLEARLRQVLPVAVTAPIDGGTVTTTTTTSTPVAPPPAPSAPTVEPPDGAAALIRTPDYSLSGALSPAASAPSDDTASTAILPRVVAPPPHG